MGSELARVDAFLAAEPELPSVMSLMDVPLREEVELERLEVPDDEAEPLLERGVLPGCRLRRVRNSPSGDPIVSVEGTLLALRRECAALLFVRAIRTAPAGTA